ncbi:hypothetical protein WR25_03424 isoform B [Diploscapter pachys]|uniref:Uncharacterized protein n=1 Tax=Diploscapter pachys TaxID=2018661 RepID=A0A2A2J7F5_9BILA|nr:hypothetical protein WR25_03424 isoform B [Diploscapter pachys]
MSVEPKSGALIKWAMVISVSSKDVPSIDELSTDMLEFSRWFMKNLSVIGEQINVYYDYEASPSCVHHVEPGDEVGVVRAYEAIRVAFPDVIVVLHILPGPNSEEYLWMKRCARRYGLIRQGVLYENAKNRFRNMPLDEVCKNISQWIARSFYIIVHDTEKPMRVGRGCRTLTLKYPMNSKDLVNSVMTVIHGNALLSDEGSETSVRVYGLPTTFNEFSVAQVFMPLQIMSVSVFFIYFKIVNIYFLNFKNIS